MKCPKCTCVQLVKDGFTKGRQRYLCKSCGYRHSVVHKSTARSMEIKRLALMMYLEGLGFNSIGRLLKVSHVAVLKWIRSYGQKAQELKKSEPMKITELDEMHTYIGRKKTLNGYGLLLIEAGEDTWTSRWVVATPQREKSSGRKSNTPAKDGS